MRPPIIRILAALALAAVAGAAAPGASVEVPDLQLTPNADRPGARVAVSTPADDFGPVALDLVVMDGKPTPEKTLEPVAAPAPGVTDYGDGLSVAQRFESTGGHVVWRLIVTNTGAEQRWLRLRAAARPGKPGGTSLFDGRYYRDPCKGDSHIGDLTISVPLVVIHRDQAGLAWGIHPEQIISYFEGGSDFSDETNPQFYFGVKMVVDPGQAETLDLILLGFEPRFGYLDGFQRYHREFPKNFSVDRPGVDPRTSYGGCDYRAWSKGEPETVRRFGGRWEWCLRSFAHRGDWKVTRKFWEVGIESGDKRNRFNEQSFASAIDWRDTTYERYAHGELCDVAMLFYYATALTDDDGPRTPIADQFWPEAYAGVTGTYKVCYSWGDNGYAQQNLRALGELGEELPISGYAMDTAGTPLKHFGAGIESAPCRAWLKADPSAKKRYEYLEDGTKVEIKNDKTGVYATVASSTAQFMDYIHTLERGCHKLALVPNKPSWIEGLRCDAVLIEHVPGMLDERLWIQRLYCGQKVFSWWDEFRMYRKIDWQNMTPEQVRNSVEAFSRFVRLKSYTFAGIPMYRIAVGNEILQSAIDELNLLTQAGWNATPATTTDAPLWLVRYGKGLDSYIVACNPKARDITADLAIDTDYLGGGGFVFADARGGAIKGRTGGDGTHVTLSIPSAREAVIESVLRLRLSNPAASVGVETLVTDTLNERVVTAALSPSEAVTAVAEVGAPKYYYLDSVEWNGAPVPLSRGGKFVLSMKEAGELTLRFKSLYFASDGEAFTNFPFVKDNKSVAMIVIPNEPSEAEEYNAFRVQEYFRYYYENAVKGAPDIKLPIVKASEAPADGPRVLIGKAAEDYRDFWPWESPARTRIGVDRDKEILYITSRELCDDDRLEGLYRLLAHLDKTHPYIGKIGRGVRFEHDHEEALYKKAGLTGEVLKAKGQ